MEQIKVLIIDPDDASRIFLTQMLTKRNYAAIHARNRQEGLSLAAAQPPSLIICETNLGNGTALEFLHDIEAIPTLAGVPLVVLTAHSDPEEMQVHLQAGFAEYYVKSGMVMMGLVEAIPKLLLAGRKRQTENRPGFLFAFVSAKGGIGTSSLCANIGMNLANHITQATVAVMDMVLPIGSIADIVGHKDEFNLVHVTELPLESITPEYLRENLPIPPHWGFRLLPGSPDPKAAAKLQVDRIAPIVDSLRKSYQYTLIDLGRSLSRISMPIIKAADLIVLILSPDLSGAAHTKKLWTYFQEEGIEPRRIFPILNRAVGLEGLTKTEAELMLGLDIRMTMPYLMGNFTLANNQNMPISLKFPSDTASMVLKEAAIELSRHAVKLLNR